MSFASKWQAWVPEFHSLLRIVAGLLFFFVGTVKLFSFPVGMPGGMVVSLASLIGVAGVLEVVGGALMVLGLWTRPVAFILAGEMAIAYFIGHAGGGFWPLVNGGTDAILFCFIWLFMSAAGGGAWSVDAWMAKRETETSVA